MSTNPLGDAVSDQYERWMYPEPIVDLPAWLSSHWEWFDPSHAHRLLWPDRSYRPDMRILIAGCGTNQAAVLAYNNPTASVVAIDVSQASLDHQQFLKGKYGLKNLELRRLPIEEVGSLQRGFDLIVSTGVLHHLADPQTGMDALADCLLPEGVMAIMLYARYGRLGVEMLQGLFRELRLRQDEESIAMVREALAKLDPDHPVQSYLGIAPDLAFDAGLVDTFLHGRERSYTVDDCMDLVSSADLVFQDWFLRSPYEPASVPGDGFLGAISELPDSRRWAAMERINTRNACHFFTACRADRPQASYRIDLASPEALEYVPAFRYRCGIEGGNAVRPDWRLALDPRQRMLAEQIDGVRTVQRIIERVSRLLPPDERDAAELESVTRAFLVLLRNRDFISIGLNPSASLASSA